MGWAFHMGETRSGLIAYLTRRQENDIAIWEVLKKCIHGNVLWYVTKKTYKKTGESETYICCDLLQNECGYGWGYKDMCESQHPYYYSCPLEYLNIAPVKNAEWRANVMKWHDERKKQREKYAVAQPGYTYSLVCANIPKITLVRKQGRSWIGVYQNCEYRIPMKFLGDVILENS